MLHDAIEQSHTDLSTGMPFLNWALTLDNEVKKDNDARKEQEARRWKLMKMALTFSAGLGGLYGARRMLSSRDKRKGRD